MKKAIKNLKLRETLRALDSQSCGRVRGRETPQQPQPPHIHSEDEVCMITEAFCYM